MKYHTTAEGDIPFTEEEEEEWKAKEAAWAASANDRKAAEVRAERNAKLAATDWTQITDATVDKTAWAVYRMMLRDIPEQNGFPNNVVWPDAP